MITPAYALTAVERVLPRMALDFTTASLDSRVTVTRTLNTATRVNSSGYIETVNADLPRFDFSPTSIGTCRGLLIEETRANLMLYSQDFQQAAVWFPSGLSVVTANTTSPTGASTVDSLVENSSPGTHSVSRSGTAVASATTYTYSVYAKANGRDWIAIQFTGAGVAANYGAYFNISSGTVGNLLNAPASATITSAGNGWYRCSVTTLATVGVAVNVFTYLASANGSVSYTGDGSSGVFMFGAQLEAGAFATSYIPTTTTSLTRNADVVRMTGTNFSDWYNASEGSFAVVADTAKPTSLASSVFILSADDGTTANRISMRYFTGNAEELVQVSSAVSAQLQKTYVANTSERFAMAYKLDSFALAANGTTVVTDPLGSLPTVNQLCIGSTASLVQLNGHIGKLMYWPQRLTNAEIQAFSK